MSLLTFTLLPPYFGGHYHLLLTDVTNILQWSISLAPKRHRQRAIFVLSQIHITLIRKYEADDMLDQQNLYRGQTAQQDYSRNVYYRACSMYL